MPPQDSDAKEIASRLDTIIKLMAARFARDLNNSEAIVKLEQMQLTREQIADALGITTQNVAQVIYISKRAEKKTDKRFKKGATTGTELAAEPPVAAEEVQQ